MVDHLTNDVNNDIYEDARPAIESLYNSSQYDLLTNDVNNGSYEDIQSAIESLYNSNQYDLLTSLSSTSDLISMNISNDSSDFYHLKIKMNSFIHDYPTIVAEIKDYFSDELIEHILKRAFRVQFTTADSVHTNSLLNHFFYKHDRNIRIIFNYFFDDIRSMILSGKFHGLPWPICQAIIYTPKSVLLTLTMTWLHLKGAQTFTTNIYRDLLNPTKNNNESVMRPLTILSFSFEQSNIWLFIIGYIFLLIAINIHSISVLINFSTVFLIIGFILYFTLAHFFRFNQ